MIMGFKKRFKISLYELRAGLNENKTPARLLYETKSVWVIRLESRCDFSFVTLAPEFDLLP